jgi:hypothetical protein
MAQYPRILVGRKRLKVQAVYSMTVGNPNQYSVPARQHRGAFAGLLFEGRWQSPLANPSYAGLTRVSINLEKSLAKKMDGRVKFGHDDLP